MKKLIAGVMLAILSGFTSIAEAAVTPDRRPIVAWAPVTPAAQTTTPAASESSDYAKREKANPALGEYQGGGSGLYIGSGAVTVLLIVLLVLLLV